MEYKHDEPLWEEKYRPKKVDDVILPKKLKTMFLGMLDTEIVPNMILCGTAGTGKTTVAKALCEELEYSYIVIDGSDENGVDMVRNKAKDHAHSLSLTSKRKAIIIDEADYLSTNAQPALRGLIQSSSKNCSVIMTCNYPNRIIDPLFSRCKKIDFSFNKQDKVSCMKEFYKRIEFILNNEKIKFDKISVIKLINACYPDARKIIGILQTYSISGEIDEGILSFVDSNKYDELIGYLREQKFNSVNKWLTNAASNDLSSLYSELFKRMYDKVEKNSIPELVLIAAEWQKYHSSVADQNLNILAMLTEIMASVKFNK